MKITDLHRYLLTGLFALTFAFSFAAGAARAGEEEDLIATLQSGAGVPEKCAACQRLRLVGTVKSVPVLAGFLGEERTGHAARYALEGLPLAEAGAALREAIPRTTGRTQAGLADSAGWRRDATAVPMLVPLLSGEDEMVVGAAAAALGRIGGDEAVGALRAARDRVPAAVRPVVVGALLQGAEHLLAAGKAERAAGLYRELGTQEAPAHVRGAAWRGLVLADAGARADLVRRALSGQDRPLQLAALKLIRELDDPVVVRACGRAWDQLPEDSQLAVLEAHARLGGEALPTIRAATGSPHVLVRTAGWQALGEHGDASFIPALARAAAEGAPAEREAARETLARIEGGTVRAVLLEQVETAGAPERAELARALGERGDREAAGVLVQQAIRGPEPVRLAALESLRKLAVAETVAPLLELAAKSKSEGDREPVLKALYAVCQASADKEETARRVVAAMGGFPAAERRQVLPLLAELGTASALAAAEAATRDADAELAKEALRVLAQWPTAAPAAHLLGLARTSTDGTTRVLALRAGIEVAGQEPDGARRLDWLREAMQLAGRPDEKRQALGKLGQMASAEALEAALALLDEADLAAEAGLAAVSIAERLAAAGDPQVGPAVATKVLARVNTPEIVRRAWALRAKPASAGPFIQDWLASGPYRQPSGNDAFQLFDVAFPPEKAGAAVQWRSVPRGDMVDLSGLWPSEAGCVAYLRTTLVAPVAGEAALLMGSDDGLKVWLNGEIVHANNVDRGAVVDQDMAPITLKPGANELLLKVTQGGGGWAACARVVGRDGQPIAGLKARAEVSSAILLWPEGAPGALGEADTDRPTLTPYPAPVEKATGAAVVVCPGGAYLGLAGHEGKDYALYLNEQGVSAFVLKYRLGSQGYRHPRMLEDAARAVRLVRARAAEWQVDPKRVGIMGSSAGGHLASTLLTHFDGGDPHASDPVERQSSRPDLGILCYPVISMTPELTHQGSRNALLGPAPSEELVQLLSNEKQVTRETPPCFIWHTWEDGGVKVENALVFAAALRAAGVPFDLHVYQKGGHGIGLGDKPPFNQVHPWARDLVFWLRANGFVK